MNTGLGFSEMLLIVILVLVFFGSKELPVFIRKAAQVMAGLRRYTEKIRSELDSITNISDQNTDKPIIIADDKKKLLRSNYLSVRKSILPEEHRQKSEAVFQHLQSTAEYCNARAVMIYVSNGSEVATRKMITDILASGKRVVVPYCIRERNELGLAEIKDPENDLICGEYGIYEPKVELRDKFFRSDLHLVICPGVAFDSFGSRLGMGKAYYDRFLRELKGKIPIVGLAFDCQISKEPLPFDYHDVNMDQIITESGVVIQKNVATINTDTPQKTAG